MSNSDHQKQPTGGSNNNSRPAPKAEGLSSLRTTVAFRAFNFELYAKPNKYVMGFGLIAITGCVTYLAYMNASAENRADQIYQVLDSEGSVITTQRRTTKWD